MIRKSHICCKTQSIERHILKSYQHNYQPGEKFSHVPECIFINYCFLKRNNFIHRNKIKNTIFNILIIYV